MSEELRTLTPERVNSYLDITRRARAKATPSGRCREPRGQTSGNHDEDGR